MFWPAFVAVIAALCLWVPFGTLPFPYEAIPIQDITDERFERLIKAQENVKCGPTRPVPCGSKFEDGYRALNGTRLSRLFEGKVIGAESVAVSPSGRLTMMDKYGYVHHAQSSTTDGFQMESPPADGPLYIGPGRPLGYHYLNDNILIVCDSIKGLTEVNLKDSTIRILANSVDGTPIDYANDLDVDPTGRWVYFSSSTKGVVGYSSLRFYDTMRSFMLNMYSADVSGRLMKYDRHTGKTEVVMQDVWYANGVAVSHDGDFVLLVETMGFRVMRKWIKGPKAGQVDTLIDNLPGFPDGISRSGDGNYWVCLVVPLTPVLKFLKPKMTRWFLAHLGTTINLAKYIAKQWGCVVKVSPTGEILDVLFDPTGQSAMTVSAVTEHDGNLFLGNLGGDYVSVYRL